MMKATFEISNNQLLLIICFSDNKSLYISIHSTKTVTDKRLLIDMSLIREMLDCPEISIDLKLMKFWKVSQNMLLLV